MTSFPNFNQKVDSGDHKPSVESNADDITPFKIAIPPSTLDDLQMRLAQAKLPQSLSLPAESEWSYGVPTHVVQELLSAWTNPSKFDWSQIENELNESLPQYMTKIDAGHPHGVLRVHFVHKTSERKDAVPLVFCHGWPGSFLEVRVL